MVGRAMHLGCIPKKVSWVRVGNATAGSALKRCVYMDSYDSCNTPSPFKCLHKAQHHPYTILYYTILYYTVLYYTILYYTILYYTILYYTILYYTILYYTILYYTILYYTTPHYTILYYTILYYAIPAPTLCA